MTDPYAELEKRHDGPIPQPALDRVRYGSAAAAEPYRTRFSAGWGMGPS